MFGFILIPENIVEEANRNKFLKNKIDTFAPDDERVPIFDNEDARKIVGFFTQEHLFRNNKKYKNIVHVYVLENYRNKGLASNAIKTFIEMIFLLCQ